PPPRIHVLGRGSLPRLPPPKRRRYWFPTPEQHRARFHRPWRYPKQWDRIGLCPGGPCRPYSNALAKRAMASSLEISPINTCWKVAGQRDSTHSAIWGTPGNTPAYGASWLEATWNRFSWNSGRAATDFKMGT